MLLRLARPVLRSGSSFPCFVQRQPIPMTLSHKQATALAAEIYKAWVDGEREKTVAILRTPQGWVDGSVTPEEEEAGFRAAIAKLGPLADSDGTSELEASFGPLVDRILLARGIASVQPDTPQMLLQAFLLALRDAFESRSRNAGGDYPPDPKAQWFPEWEAPAGDTKPEPRLSKASDAIHRGPETRKAG